MHYSTRFLVGCAFVCIGGVSLHALNFRECKVDPLKQNATVYLRWEGDNYTDGSISYTVVRINNGNRETLASGLQRLEYFDLSVKPGETYQYQIVSTTGNTVSSGNLSVPARNHSHPVYSLNVEYEVSFDELLNNGWRSQGFHVPTGGNDTGKEISDVSWRAKQPVSDDFNYKFLPKSKYHEDNYGESQLSGMSADNFYLDGNRYLWIQDGQRTSGERYYCEIPNFRVNGDYKISDADVAKTTEAAERYPWAGVGYSWRSVMSGASANNRVEKCWYINVRENGKYGVLCVWGPDQYGRRPYQNHPFYLDWAKFRSDYDGSFYDNTFGYTWPNRSGIDNSADESYSVAFSDDGRSYLRRTGFGDIKRRSVFFSIHSDREQGRRHDWKPARSESRYTFLRSDKDGDLPGGINLASGRADLLNVKGNLSNANYSDATDATQAQNYAWIWQITNYGSANNQVIVRGDRINRGGDITNGNRIRLQGFADLYGNGEGYMGNQNYVVPMSGNGSDDIFVQLSNSGRTSPSEDYPHLYYLYSSVVNDKSGTASKNKEYYTTTRDVTKAADVQRIDLGMQYNHIVGGCTFDFKGEKFMVLPATRQGDHNMGDFTIFRIDGRADGNQHITLTPVVNYTSPAIQDKQWSSTAGKDANPNRTFIRTFLKKENRPGFDNDDEYVEIYLYLPGRTINMYTFYGTYVPDGYPVIEMRPNIVNTESYLHDRGYQHLVNYDITTGQGRERHSDNPQAPHLKEFYSHISWDSYRNQTWGNPGDRDTNIRLAELQSVNYLQKSDGNWQAFYPYGTRHEAGSDCFWEYGNHIGGPYGTSIWTRPQYKRKIGNTEQTLYGNNNETNSRYYYSPNPVKELTVKYFNDPSYSNGAGGTIYRVDINFSAPDPVYGHSENSNRPNGAETLIPVTRYEIVRDGRNCLTDRNYKPVAYVMVGENAYPRWEGNSDEMTPRIFAVSTIDRSTGNSTSLNGISIPGNYNFGNRRNARYALTAGEKNDGKGDCVVTLIGTDPALTTDTYRVRAVYGTDNWNGSLEPYGNYGVSKYADATARAMSGGTTGVDDIAADDTADSRTEYYTLQGVRLSGVPTVPGIYLRRGATGTVKIQIR